MSKHLNVLIIEDREDDAILILRDLKRGGFIPNYKRVETAEEMQIALHEQPWDIVLSDYSLPQFNAPSALAVLKKANLDIPFIIISGTISEEIAVESLKAGAHDFIAKRKTARLIPAVERELREAEIRRKKAVAEKRFRALIEYSSDAITLVDSEGGILFGSPAVTQILGYPLEEWVGQNGFEFVHPDEQPQLQEQFNDIIHNRTAHLSLEARLRCRDGSYRWTGLVTSRFVSESDEVQVIANFRDITKRKQYETAMLSYNERLEILHEIDQLILSTQSLELVSEAVAGYIYQQMGVAGCSVLLFDHVTQQAHVIASRNRNGAGLSSGTTLPLDAIPSSMLDSQQSKQVYIIEGTPHQKSSIIAPHAEIEELHPTAWIPLTRKKEVIGALCLGIEASNALTAEQTQIAYEIANQLTIAIQQTRYRETIERQNVELEQRVLQRTSELQRAKEEIESILNNSSDTIILTNLDGRIERANPSITELFGYSPDEVLHQYVDILIDSKWAEYMTDIASDVINKCQPVSVEIMARRNDSTQFYCDLALAPVMNNELVGLIYTLRDISKRKADEQRLQESEEKYRVLVESAEAAISIFNLDGTWAYMNPAMAQMFNGEPEDFLGKTMYDFFPPEIAQRQVDHNNRVLESGQGETLEVQSVINGQTGWFRANVQPLKNGSGEVYSLLAIVIDITERIETERALQASEEKYRALIDFAPDPIIITDEQGRIMLTNKQVETVIGYDGQNELIGKSVEKLLPEYLRDSHRNHRVNYMEAPHMRQVDERAELKLLKKDGTEMSVKIGLSPITTGGERLIMSYIVDMTTQKELEENLRLSLTKEKELNELKSQFISTVSHEFKTPLSVILSAADTLKNYSDRLTEEKKLKRLETIRAHVKRLNNLLEDTLILTRADTVGFRFDPTPVDLEVFCMEIVTEIQLTCQSTHEIIFSSRGDTAPILVDVRLLQHTLVNLLSNAVKYSPNGGRIYFDLACVSEEIVLQIRDEGIGIPQSEQSRLFEAFHRASNVGNIAGTGLGLRIARESIEAHGSTITFESQEGIGTTFIIRLPLRLVRAEE